MPAAMEQWTHSGVRPSTSSPRSAAAGGGGGGASSIPSGSSLMNHAYSSSLSLSSTLAPESEVPSRTPLARPSTGFGVGGFDATSTGTFGPFGGVSSRAGGLSSRVNGVTSRYSDKLLSQLSSEQAARSAQASRMRLATEALARKGRVLYHDSGLPMLTLTQHTAGYMAPASAFQDGQLPAIWGGGGGGGASSKPGSSFAPSPTIGSRGSATTTGLDGMSPPTRPGTATGGALVAMSPRAMSTATVYTDGEATMAPVSVSVGVQVAPTGWTRYFFNDEQIQRASSKRLLASQGAENQSTIAVVSGMPGATAAAGPWLYMHFDVRIPDARELAAGIVGDLRIEPFGNGKKVAVLSAIFDPLIDNVQEMWDRLHYASLECHLGMNPGAGGWPSAPGGARSKAVISNPGVPLCCTDESGEAAKSVLAVAKYATIVLPRGREDALALIRLQAGLLGIFVDSLEKADSIAAAMRDNAIGDAAKAFEDLENLTKQHEEMNKAHDRELSDLRMAHDEAMKKAEKKASEQFMALRSEIEALKRKLANALAQLKQQKNVNELNNSKTTNLINDLRDELKEKNAELERLRQILATMRAEIRKLKDENLKLEQQADAGKSKDELIAEMQEKLDMTRVVNDCRNAQLKMTMGLMRALRSEMARMQAYVQNLTDQLREQEELSAELDFHLSELKMALGEMSVKLAAAENQQASRDAQMAEMEAKFRKAMEEAISSAARLEMEYDMEQQKRQMFEASLAKLQEKKDELEAEIAKYLNVTIARQGDFREQQTETIRDMNAELADELDKLKRMISESDALIESLMAQLNESRENVRKAQDAMKAMKQEHADELKMIKAERDEIIALMEAQKHASEAHDKLLHELDAERQRILDLEAQIRAYETAGREKANEEEDAELLRQKIAAMEALMETLKAERDEFSRMLDEKKGSDESLKKMMAALEEERNARMLAEQRLRGMSNLEIDLENARAELLALQGDLEERNSRIKDLEESSKRLREALEAEHLKMAEGIDASEAESIRKLHAGEMDRMQKEIEMLRKALQDAKDQKMAAEGTVSKDEHAKMLEELARLKAELEAETNSRIELQQKLNAATAGDDKSFANAEVQCEEHTHPGSYHDMFYNIKTLSDFDNNLSRAYDNFKSYWTDPNGGGQPFDATDVPCIVWQMVELDDEGPSYNVDAPMRKTLVCKKGLPPNTDGTPVVLNKPLESPAHFQCLEQGMRMVSAGLDETGMSDVVCLPIHVPKEPGSTETYVWGVISTGLERHVKHTYRMTDSVESGEKISKLSRFERAEMSPVLESLDNLAVAYGVGIGSVDMMSLRAEDAAQAAYAAQMKANMSLADGRITEKPDATGNELGLMQKKKKISGYVMWKSAMEKMQFHQVLETAAEIRKLRAALQHTFATSNAINQAFSEMKMYRNSTDVVISLVCSLFVYIHPEDDALFHNMPIEGVDNDLSDDIGPPHGFPVNKAMANQLWGVLRFHLRKLGGKPAKNLGKKLAIVKTPEECEDKREKALMERAFSTSINLSKKFTDADVKYASMALKTVKKYLEVMWSLDTALKAVKEKEAEKWDKGELLLIEAVNSKDSQALMSNIEKRANGEAAEPLNIVPDSSGVFKKANKSRYLVGSL